MLVSLFSGAAVLSLSTGFVSGAAFKLYKPVSKAHLAIGQDFADPAIFHQDETWFAFATTTKHGINVQVATSCDFNTWKLHDGTDLLPQAPAWAVQKKPDIWAPNVIKNDEDDFILYYSALATDKTAGSNGHHCVGSAISRDIMGPYDPVAEPFACYNITQTGGAIDASGFLDADGKRYVVYKEEGNTLGKKFCDNKKHPTRIMLQAVKGDGVTKIGQPTEILDRSALDGPLVEAPSLVRTKDGTYVLFFSSNCFKSSKYDITYAMADHIAGPYTKYGPFAVTGDFSLFAPGGASVTVDGKRLVFHAYDQKLDVRYMYTASIDIDTKSHIVNVQ